MQFLLLAAALLISVVNADRSFKIDFENNQFLLNEAPFRYISGSLHYFRVPNQYWEDRIVKYKAAGLNTIQTYIEWSFHEPNNGTFNFEGDADVIRFIKLAHKHDLLVILRPGPYICAERENGGLPYWLKKYDPKMKIRSSDAMYMKFVTDWFNVLLPKLHPYLYENGGPIIMVQVENEYGSYGCDFSYTASLRDLIRSHLGNEVVLFTTDGHSNDFLRCGKISGVYAAVDFGVNEDPAGAFSVQRLHESRGPLINNEFYPGWLDHWLYTHQTVDTKSVVTSLDKILAMNASVNLYMLHGGTSFGFMAGANSDSNLIYQPDPTSYDYDAPINEYGNLTEKYFEISKVIAKYTKIPSIKLPPPVPLLDPFQVNLDKLDKNFLQLLDELPTTVSSNPMTFEALNTSYGFVSYSTSISFLAPSPALLEISGLGDRAYIYVNETFGGILGRTESSSVLPIITKPNSSLRIVVENQGRIGYGPLTGEMKGIVGNVTFAGNVLTNWKQSSTQNWTEIVQMIDQLSARTRPETMIDYGKPKLYRGEFVLKEEPKDTFLDSTGWGKGVAFINEHNLGRYWPGAGPQITLYVPGVWLNEAPKNNTLLLINFEDDPCIGRNTCQISFTNKHVINAPTPYK